MTHMTTDVPRSTEQQCLHVLAQAHPDAEPATLQEAAALLADFVDDDTPPHLVERRSRMVAHQHHELFEGGARTDSLRPAREPDAPAVVHAPVTVDV